MKTILIRVSVVSLVCALMAAFAVAGASAQQVTKKEIAGISTFAQLETTIACGGSTKPEAIKEIGKMGFKSVINLRESSEESPEIGRQASVVGDCGRHWPSRHRCGHRFSPTDF